jgi:D-psicose/D-tagatose/L-ribulose 3-epimerase
LSGSFHSVFGKKSTKPVSEQLWKNSADCLRQVAKQINGYQLVLEPINRYESFLVNTAAQAEKLIEMIGEPNIKIQLDTFHMGIEEDDFYNTIKSVKDKLVHFHVAENHRGRFGHGTMQWDEVFSALADIGYKGAIVIESFVPEVTEVATAAAIWRKMAPSADALASEGLEFLRKMTEKYNL